MMVLDPKDTKPYQIRLDSAFWERVDNWRRQQADIPSRAEALRRLVRIGLEYEELRSMGFRPR